MLEYDPEENFKIDIELARKIDRMVYEGIMVTYIFDTNTIIFTKYKENGNYNDNDDLDCIVYRNYDKKYIEKYIDEQILERRK